MKYSDLPKTPREYWLWDEKQQKIISDIDAMNEKFWSQIRSYRDYLLQQSDGLASALTLRKIAGDDSAQLLEEIIQLSKYKQKLRDIPQTCKSSEVKFPEPVLDLKPMSAQEFIQQRGG